MQDVVDVIKTVGNKIGANKPVAQANKCMDAAFGDYIASKLRGYSHKTKCFVQHKINNILFEADMGMYEQAAHTIPMSITVPENTTPTTIDTLSSPSLFLSNDEGTQFTILVNNDNTQM